MEWIWPLAALAAGFVIGYLAALVRTARRPGSTRAAAELAAARTRAELLAQHNSELRERSLADADVLSALVPLQVKVQDMARQVAQMDRERAGQYAGLAQQLREARHSEERLRGATEQLAGALRSGSARGMWGEVELRRVLEASGMTRHLDFAEQRQLPGGGRPDVMVQLPGAAYVAIDAKVPLDAYLEAMSLSDAADGEVAQRRQALLAAHAKALRGHVDALATRAYHTLVAGPEFTVLFLPAESLAAAAFDADPGLLEYAMARAVVPVTPASLLALLKTVAVMWQQAEVSADAQRLLDLGRTLYGRLATLGGHMAKLGSAVEGVVAAYNRVAASLESRVMVTARSFEAFDAGGLAVSQLEADKVTVRPLASAELAQD